MTPAPCYLDRLDPASLARILADWRRVWPQSGVLALLAEADKAEVPLLQVAARDAGLPLAGAIFPALVRDRSFVAGGVWLLPLKTMPPHTLLADLPRGEAAALAIQAALAPTLDATARPATLFLLFDAMVPDIASILEGVYLGLADRVRYMGANAGSETFQPMPCLFDAQRLVSGGALCLLLDDGRGAALEHGYLAPLEPVCATATEGNRIESIDWQPAFEVYRDRIRAHYGVELTRENLYQYGVHFPFGLLLANGEVVVRIPVALEDDGSLFCVGEVPANAMLTLLQAPAVDSEHTIDHLAARLGAQFGPVWDLDLLTFYCAGRRLHLGDAAPQELDLLGRRTACARLLGALSLGEIGGLGEGQYPMFHNATLVCRPWAGESSP